MEQDLARLRLLAKVRGGDKAGEAKKKKGNLLAPGSFSEERQNGSLLVHGGAGAEPAGTPPNGAYKRLHETK
jgi:hypothetical protein